MALRSRYSQAFNKAAQAGPPIEVSGFTPGSVTTPAAILKGVSMYAKARRDEANYQLAAQQNAMSTYQGALQTRKLEQDTERVPYKGLDGQTYQLSPPEAATRASVDNSRSAITPAGVPGLSKKYLDALGLTPDDNGEVDPRSLVSATSLARARLVASGRRPSAALDKLHATAQATNDYMTNDAPLVQRHTDFLTGAGSPNAPNAHGIGGGWDDNAQAVAAQHLGIDFDAWKAHDPANFPDMTVPDPKTGAGVAIDQSKQRAQAQAWRNSTLTNATKAFQTARVGQYAARYLAPDNASAQPAPAAQDPYGDFEQEFQRAWGGAATPATPQ